MFLQTNKRKSGFGASDELSSEEEEGGDAIKVLRPFPHQERHTSTIGPISASILRKRGLHLLPNTTVGPQVINPTCIQSGFTACYSSHSEISKVMNVLFVPGLGSVHIELIENVNKNGYFSKYIL